MRLHASLAVAPTSEAAWTQIWHRKATTLKMLGRKYFSLVLKIFPQSRRKTLLRGGQGGCALYVVRDEKCMLLDRIISVHMADRFSDMGNTLFRIYRAAVVGPTCLWLLPVGNHMARHDIADRVGAWMCHARYLQSEACGGTIMPDWNDRCSQPTPSLEITLVYRTVNHMRNSFSSQCFTTVLPSSKAALAVLTIIAAWLCVLL